MNQRERFARRFHHIQETLERKAVAELEQVKQQQRDEVNELVRLESDRQLAASLFSGQGSGADWLSLHCYLEGIRAQEQIHRDRAQELAGLVEYQRSQVLAVHQEARKWERAADGYRTQELEALSVGQQRQADDMASARWERRGHL